MLTRILTLAVAMSAFPLVPAVAEITGADKNHILLAARSGDSSRTSEAIAHAAAGRPADQADGWLTALNAVAHLKDRNPKAVARMAEGAGQAALDISRTDATAGLEVMKAALSTVGGVANHAQEPAMRLAGKAAKLARGSMGSATTTAIETVLTAVTIAGPLQAVNRSAAAGIAADAKAMADQLRTSNTAIAGQIVMAVSRAKLKG